VITVVQFGELYKKAEAESDTSFEMEDLMHKIAPKWLAGQRNWRDIQPFIDRCNELGFDCQSAYPEFPEGSYCADAHEFLFLGEKYQELAICYAGYLFEFEGKGRGAARSNPT